MTLAPAVTVASAISATVTGGAAFVLMRSAPRFGLIDLPGGRKLQRRAIPLVGGALLAGVFAGGAVATRMLGVQLSPAELLGLAVPLLCFIVGVVDDARLHGLTAFTKGIATCIAFLPAMRTPAGGWASILEPATLLRAALAFLALHSTNTIDHANGLCALVAASGAGAVAIAAVAHGASGGALLAALVAGAAVGFLFLNYPRGRVFLGDGGSLLLGGCLAMALIDSGRLEWLLLVAVPLADLASVALLRIHLGVRPWIGDRRHATHRLAARGMSERRAVLLLASVQAAASALAAPRLFGPPRAGAGLLVAGVILLLALAMLCIPAAQQDSGDGAPR